MPPRRAKGGGLLIVNADDYGIDRQTTDAILDCLRAGSISSTTAMVWMADSERAAGAFPGPHAPGLHLNLIEPYTAANVPPVARERQARLARYFRRVPWSGWFYNPAIARRVNACVADQLERFAVLYDDQPTHVDGHQHFHICPNVLFSRELSGIPKLRPGHTFSKGEKPLANRVYRGALNALIRRRFITPDRFFSMRDITPALDGSGSERLRASAHISIELMTHPGWSDELSYLRSDEWRARIAGLPLGTYAEL
jgi:predicted glycoside hydrolase/deacetylase ChbG (UPF0249 family)